MYYGTYQTRSGPCSAIYPSPSQKPRKQVTLKDKLSIPKPSSNRWNYRKWPTHTLVRVNPKLKRSYQEPYGDNETDTDTLLAVQPLKFSLSTRR
ncbi:Hypothetical predicted protein, partial [Pelobates cultripes]